MKLKLFVTASLLAAAMPAIAKDVTVALNDQQQAALLQVLDQATRNGGLAAANNGTVYFYNVLKAAVDAANAPPAPKPEEKAAPAAVPAPTPDATKETPAP